MTNAVPLRRIISVIGLVVSIATAAVIPCGYFFVGYSNTQETMAFMARLNAARAAQYIYSHNALWQYQRVRLADLVRLPEVGEKPITQKIYNRVGNLVMEEAMPLTAPITSHRVPIVVSGSTVGSFVVETSLREVLYMTGLVALLSSLLGFGVYFAVRILPLRVLDHTLEALEMARRALQEHLGQRLDAALENMSQGLCMFDGEEKLVIFNPRFAEIYGVSPELIKPGMTTRELMAVVFNDKVSDVDAEGTLALQRQFLREGKSGSLIERLTDGRSISIQHRPTPDGGHVATFEDITNRIHAEEESSTWRTMMRSRTCRTAYPFMSEWNRSWII